jgi:ferritin
LEAAWGSSPIEERGNDKLHPCHLREPIHKVNHKVVLIWQVTIPELLLRASLSEAKRLYNQIETEAPMIGKAVQDAMNEQINKELFSSYLYLSMAAYFEERNLSGFGHWMRIQEAEERVHAMKLYDYVLERGGKVTLKSIEAPKTGWKSSLEVAEEIAAHEAEVTASIHALYELALKEKDYPSQGMLQWFISEQVEEEKNAAEIVANLKLIEERGTAVLMLDHQLAKRGDG